MGDNEVEGGRGCAIDVHEAARVGAPAAEAAGAERAGAGSW